jgi:hypothetical protein
MTTQSNLALILDETITALSNFDLARLQALEQSTIELAGSGLRCKAEEMNVLRAKKDVLELVLRSCEPNLNILKRLHTKSMRESWAQ